VVSFLLSVTFACGLVIAVAHVLNKGFVAPAYDVVLNMTAFAAAVASSLLLEHRAPAVLSGFAELCWLVLARRTVRARRRGLRSSGQLSLRGAQPNGSGDALAEAGAGADGPV
jgi:hypothetical protein